MSFLLDEIAINGLKRPGKVLMSFSNIDVEFDLATARSVGKALLDQTDVSELELLRYRK